MSDLDEFLGLSSRRICGVFSVHTACILFSDSRKSNYFGPKAHSPGSRAGRAEACPRGRGPTAQASSWYVGLARPPSAGVTVWGWHSTTGFYRWFFNPEDQKANSKTPRRQVYKNLCYHFDLIQDFSTWPNVGTDFC